MFGFSSTAIVDGTLYFLLGFSVITWFVIFAKMFQQWRIGQDNKGFSKAFWSAPHLQAAADLTKHDGPIARLARAGFSAITESQTAQGQDLMHGGGLQDMLERCLRQQMQRERQAMESGLAWLASIGSTAPFVGLFGTVWGIMHALQDITKRGSASLDVVAGPIGEALIATAIGIAVAIPAVLAYNYFFRRIKLSTAMLEHFATDFLNLAVKTGFHLHKVA
jgi:biopolymer transport protein ExbB